MTPEQESQEYDEVMAWIAVGVERGWVAFPSCSVHDMLPMTDEEAAEWDKGYDPCIVAMRVWYGQ